MKRNKLNENIQHLQELIRRANELINPEGSIDYLQKKDVVDRLYGRKPKCFIKLQPIGQDVSPYLLPICNRLGYEDPQVIATSIKLVQQLMSQKADMFDSNDIQKVLNQLNHRNNVLSKTIPHPANMAAKKAMVTKMFGNIKSHLNRMKGIE